MILTDHLADAVAPGEASADTGVVCGRFSAPIPDRRIVQQIEFESGDPAFAGTMTMIWSLAATPEGTEVTIRCEDVPEGIRKGTMTRV